MSTLYESWCESGGDWRKSKIYLQVKQSERFSRVGVREWMTRAEMIDRFGPEGTAAIIDRKLSDKDLAKSETRRHPEAPDCDSLMQFLCLNQEKETDSTETTVNTLYEAAEAESSSSDSSNDDSTDTESSEVEKKKKKKKGKSTKEKKTKKPRKNDSKAKAVIGRGRGEDGAYTMHACLLLAKAKAKGAAKKKDKKQKKEKKVKEEDEEAGSDEVEKAKCKAEQQEAMKRAKKALTSPKLRDAVLLDIQASSPASDAECCPASQSWEAAVASVQGVRDELLQALDSKEDPHYIEVPVLDLNQDENVTLARLPMLDVHDVLAYVHDTVGLRSPNEHVEMYWSWGKRHGAGWSRLGGCGLVPVGLYADETKYGGPFSDEKVLGVFINLVLHRPASIRYSRFCIFACRSALILGNRTLYPIFHRIVWGFHWAFRGLRPDGELLCKDGTKFLCTELRGDLAWHKCIWGFDKKGWQAKDVCWFCNAKNQGDSCLYTEIGEDADWVETIVENTWQWAHDTLPQHNLIGLIEAGFYGSPQDSLKLNLSRARRIAASVTQALSEAERQTLEELQQPVTPVRALTRWLGPEKAQDLLSVGTWYEVTEQQEITCRDEVMTSVFLAVPGLSDVQMEVQTGTQNRPAMLLRTAQGAVCPAEALIGSHCRGKWIAVARSCGLMIHEIQLLKEDIASEGFDETRGALLTLGLHQQLLESDQLSAMYTLSKGGGWRGVTFDAKTSKRLSKALGSFGPRKRSSYSKRQSYVRVGSKQTADLAVPITSSRSVRLPSDDGNIPVAAVLDFQRFVSDSGRLSVEFDEEATHPVEANEAPNKPNMMLNRYSVGANLNKLQSKTALGELRFNPDND
eukprot:s959_g4.t1